MESSTIVFSIAIAAMLGCVMLLPLDLFLGEYLEKRYHMYPMFNFECFCGYKVNMSRMFPCPLAIGPIKVLWHIRHCLEWLVRRDPRLTIYYQVDMIRGPWSHSEHMLKFFIKRSSEERGGGG